jgi:hypothetical protein
MEKVEKGPKEIFTPDIQKVTAQKISLACAYSSSTDVSTLLVIIQNAELELFVLIQKGFPSHIEV